MRKEIIYIMILPLLWWSCEKEEDKLPGRYLTDRVGQTDMESGNGVDYRKQAYYDLSANQNKGTHDRDAWDIAFGCDPVNPNIFVNAAMLMRIASTGKIDFNQPVNPQDFVNDLQYERSTHYFRSGWMKSDFDDQGIAKGEVFLIDLGLNLQNQSRGYKIMQITGFDNSSYTVRVSNPDNSDQQQFSVDIDQAYNNVYISFSNASNRLILEPPKDEWDLLFTKYMERLYDGVDSVDYSVTGCLINPYGTLAYLHEESVLDTTIRFYDLNASDINDAQYSARSNVIGHTWKFFDLNGSGKFLIEPHRYYFVKDEAGVNYRLRFTGFYNELGNKGAVTFEYLEL